MCCEIVKKCSTDAAYLYNYSGSCHGSSEMMLKNQRKSKKEITSMEIRKG
jgi:hypothetical protein